MKQLFLCFFQHVCLQSCNFLRLYYSLDINFVHKQQVYKQFLQVCAYVIKNNNAIITFTNKKLKSQQLLNFLSAKQSHHLTRYYKGEKFMKHSAKNEVKAHIKKYDPLQPFKENDQYESGEFALRPIKGGNNATKKIPLIKRFSPFLILICVLVFLFPYMMISGTGNIQSFWLLLFLFPFLVCNLFYADFAIWKYFSGKKIIPIWAVELTVSLLIVHFLV